VKKLWPVVALVALAALTSKTYADVQNIRLSGDIRIRGYFLDNAGGIVDPNTGELDQAKANTSFISQRTRVSVEADLEDHVLVVVTLKAEGTWGSNDQTLDNSGAGTVGGSLINRGFGVGIDEAYVQLNEMFYTAATLKLGRQFLNYGHGLILSSAEQEYNYDAGRLVLDFYPLTIDLVGAEVVNNQSFAATPNKLVGLTTGSADLLFVNARYELTDSAIKNVEAYFGWLAQGASGTNNAFSRVPPSVNGASPWILGVRSDLQPADGFQVWLEGAYEGGANGVNDPVNIDAFLVNLGGRFTMKNSQWTPAMNANYLYASGNFVPWFDYVEGYNGYVFVPRLSNMHIFNLGASVKPYENTTLSVQGYYYMKADVGMPASSDPNVDFGGLEFVPTANSSGLGWEIDGILGYDYSKDVRLQLVYGAFLPGGAFGTADAAAVQEVRGEVNVKF